MTWAVAVTWQRLWGFALVWLGWFFCAFVIYRGYVNVHGSREKENVAYTHLRCNICSHQRLNQAISDSVTTTFSLLFLLFLFFESWITESTSRSLCNTFFRSHYIPSIMILLLKTCKKIYKLSLIDYMRLFQSQKSKLIWHHIKLMVYVFSYTTIKLLNNVKLYIKLSRRISFHHIRKNNYFLNHVVII